MCSWKFRQCHNDSAKLRMNENVARLDDTLTITSDNTWQTMALKLENTTNNNAWQILVGGSGNTTTSSGYDCIYDCISSIFINVK